MKTGWHLFGSRPEIVSADELFWTRFLYKNLDRIVRILAVIPKESKCIVCGSMNFTSRTSLTNHIRNHKALTVNYWLNHMIQKSPEEMEHILYDGVVDGVADY